MENQTLFFFSALGVFNGVLTSFYLFFFSKKKKIPNYFLGLLVLMLSIRIGKSIYLIFNENNVRLFLQIGLSACFMIGVMLYYYLKASVGTIKKVPISWKVHIIALLVFILLVGLVRPYEIYPAFWGSYFIDFIYIIWGIYIVISGFVLKNICIKFFNKKKECVVSELWLLLVYIGNIIIYCGYIVGMHKWYVAGALTFSSVIYLLIFFLLYKKNREQIFQGIPEKYGSKKNKKTKVEVEALFNRLNELMIIRRLYKNPNLKLRDVAQELDISLHELSQFLNDNLNTNFPFFVNEFRVNEAKELLKTNTQFTLEAIGYDSGFSSKSSFYAIFKKSVGCTPLQYKRQLLER